jgi:hypothetical protein
MRNVEQHPEITAGFKRLHPFRNVIFYHFEFKNDFRALIPSGSILCFITFRQTHGHLRIVVVVVVVIVVLLLFLL